MTYKIIHPDSVQENQFGVIKVKELFNSSEFEAMSAAVITLSGKNRKTKHTVSSSFYYVLEGSGAFTINDERNEVSKGDLVFIPQGSVYFDEGDMTLLAINSPRFNAESVEEIN